MAMSELAELEKEALSLSPKEREHLALAVWGSLEGGPDFDPEGVAIAVHRDQEIESGTVHPLSHAEFMRRIAYSAS